jgi:hypothetical protein
LQFTVSHSGTCSVAPGCQYVYVQVTGGSPGQALSCSAAGVGTTSWGPYSITTGAPPYNGPSNHRLFDSASIRFPDGTYNAGDGSSGIHCT